MVNCCIKMRGAKIEPVPDPDIDEDLDTGLNFNLDDILNPPEEELALEQQVAAPVLLELNPPGSSEESDSDVGGFEDLESYTPSDDSTLSVDSLLLELEAELGVAVDPFGIPIHPQVENVVEQGENQQDPSSQPEAQD